MFGGTDLPLPRPVLRSGGGDGSRGAKCCWIFLAASARVTLLSILETGVGVGGGSESSLSLSLGISGVGGGSLDAMFADLFSFSRFDYRLDLHNRIV